MKLDKGDIIKDFSTGIQWKNIRVSDGKSNETVLSLCFDRNFLDDELRIQDEKDEYKRIGKWIDKEIDKFLSKLSRTSGLFKKPFHFKIYAKSLKRREYVLKFLKKKDFI